MFLLHSFDFMVSLNYRFLSCLNKGYVMLLCYAAMLCYVMLCYVMYVMLCYVLSTDILSWNNISKNVS